MNNLLKELNAIYIDLSDLLVEFDEILTEEKLDRKKLEQLREDFKEVIWYTK